jgi:hypothetical protein
LRHVSHIEVFHAQAFSSSTIEQPSRYALVINLKTTKSLDLEVSASLLARAHEMIE